MRKDVSLLKWDNLCGNSGTVQRYLRRPKGGAGMLLANRDFRAGSTNAGCGDRVLPGRGHPLSFAKAPDRAIQGPHLEKQDLTRHCPEEPIKLGIVISLPLQDLRIAVGLRAPCCRGRAGCQFLNRLGAGHGLDGFGVVIGASRRTQEGNQQAQ